MAVDEPGQNRDAARGKITQEALARLLGTHRSTVTVAASFLQKTGLIENHRGSVGIVNRRGLEQAACECYRALVQRIAKWDGESSQ